MFDSELIAQLENTEPGIMLAALLREVDKHEISGRARVAVLRARRRQISYLEARLLSDMTAIVDAVAEIDDLDDQLVFDAGASEVRSALALTRRAAETQVELALTLRQRLPQVAAALEAGSIDLRRVLVIDRGTAHLDPATARAVVDVVLPEAGKLTTSQLAARLRKLCIDVDPGQAAERYDTAVAERRVVVRPTVDGTAHLLGLDLPPDRVIAISSRVDHIAKSLRRDGETRTMDQLRADVLLDLLDGERNTKGGVVEVRVDLETLARLADHSGDLGGYGPIVAEIARKLADDYRDGMWRFAATDSGTIVDSGTIRRRPTAAQRRHVQATLPTCIFPGCRMPAASCDIDHTVPWSQGGPTTVDNTAPLCRYDHVLKDTVGWGCRQTSPGSFEWTSLLGHTYVTTGRSP